MRSFTLTLASSTIVAALDPFFILSGDSTTAPDGGWGARFLALTQNGASGVNLGSGGATTVSIRTRGFWEEALNTIAEVKDSHEPIVTIQFGHNDQKEEAGISLEQFQANLEQLAREVIEAGGTPIILSSLTRRTFQNGAVVENLAEHSAAAQAATEALGIQFLPLNAASTDYINAIGSSNADYYNWESGDRTHLNIAGEKVFGRMVADLLIAARPDVAEFLVENKALSDKIAAGEFATGDE